MGVEYYRRSRSRVTEVGDQGVFMVGSQRFSLTALKGVRRRESKFQLEKFLGVQECPVILTNRIRSRAFLREATQAPIFTVSIFSPFVFH